MWEGYTPLQVATRNLCVLDEGGMRVSSLAQTTHDFTLVLYCVNKLIRNLVKGECRWTSAAQLYS